MENLNRLSDILKYQMTQAEARAFKLALIWEELTKKEFPGKPCGKLPIKGDPRKSHLFKYCFKLLRETKGIILDDQYQWYVKAQLDILKNLGPDRNISPNCLVGERAWRRWKVWAKKFEAMSMVNRAQIEVADSKITAKLKKTKDFLFSQFKGPPTAEDICQAYHSRALIRWLTLGKVCGYYVLLSPFVDRCLQGKDFEKEFYFDLSIYRCHLNDAVREYFSNEFDYEHQ